MQFIGGRGDESASKGSRPERAAGADEIQDSNVGDDDIPF
jgi:hypothetical protein